MKVGSERPHRDGEAGTTQPLAGPTWRARFIAIPGMRSRPGWPPWRGRSREDVALAGAVVVVLALAVWLRLWTPSQLWLDEALTVNIAHLPLGQIPAALRRDGAPPLYYLLLHAWTAVFGTGNLAARSLSGVIGLVNLPLAFVAGRRVGSRWWRGDEMAAEDRRRGAIVGWTVMLLLATSPFAVYYDTESRMYALVILLTTTGLLAMTSLLRRPSVGSFAGLALSAAALLYTQYWALYLLAALGAGLAWCALRGPQARSCRIALAALSTGAILFLPWVPNFLFQLRHTGTPWATPADWTALVFTVTQFAGGNSTAGRALALLFFFLGMLALLGAGLGGSRVELELRTRPGVRALASAAAATLILAVALGKLTGSAFADRYTAVVVLPCLLVAAYGVTAISSTTLRRAVTGLAVVLGLAAAVPNAFISRTQAGQVATAISSRARSGDVVAYCPDQLGPAVSRALAGDRARPASVEVATALGSAGGPPGHLLELTYPRRTGPQFVDWIDYAKVNGSASPLAFARYLALLAGPHHAIWYVSAPGYLTFGAACESIAADLGTLDRPGKQVLGQAPSDTPFEIFEGESLARYGGT